MPVRRSSIVLAGLGVVLIVLAVLIRFIVVPIATKLPGNTNLGIKYAGTATMLNGPALQSGDTKHVVAANVPMTVDRRVKVTSTHGDTAIVSDSLTVHAGGQSLPSVHMYALDRTSLAGAAPPAGTSVEPSKGALSSAFPIGPKADNSYRYYDSTTQAIVPITYTGHAKRDGRPVSVYKIAAVGTVKDPGLLKTLPPALPKKLIVALAPLLPAAVRAEINPATLSAMPDPIPLSYTGTTDIVAYVDTQTGVAVDQTISQQVVVTVSAGPRTLSLLPALALNFHITPASLSYLADKAHSAGRLLTLVQVIVPIALIVIGLALVVVAVVRRRKPVSASRSSAGATTDSARAKSPLGTASPR